MDPNSPSLSEPPPVATAQSHSAQQLHDHPLWQQAAGRGKGRGAMGPPSARGRGRGKAAQPSAEEEGAVRYERISLLAAELQQAATGGDGADSALLSSDDEAEPVRKRRREERPDNEEDIEYADEDDDPDAERISALASSDDEGPSKAPPKRPKEAKRSKQGTSAVDMMAAAAFGGQMDTSADTSDDESRASRTSSSRMRTARKEIFPIKGVNCVGCALANRIGPVERFVNQNVNRLAETALWKMAALCWKREVVEPARREGVDVVDWAWRDVASHFRLHTTDSIIGRTAMIQSLVAMRCQVEGSLVRVENGERTLDKASAELFLKVQAAESRERSLRDACVSGGRSRGASAGQRPAGEE